MVTRNLNQSACNILSGISNTMKGRHHHTPSNTTLITTDCSDNDSTTSSNTTTRNELRISSSSSRVTFSPQVTYIPSVEDCTTEDRPRTWYDRKEIESFEREWYISDMIARRHKEDMDWYAAKKKGCTSSSSSFSSTSSSSKTKGSGTGQTESNEHQVGTNDPTEETKCRRRRMYDAIYSIQVFERAVGIQVPELKAHMCSQLSSR